MANEAIEFSVVPDGQRTGVPHSIDTLVKTEDRSYTDSMGNTVETDVTVEVLLHVDGERVDARSQTITSGESVTIQFQQSFFDTGDYRLRADAVLDYEKTTYDEELSATQTITIIEPIESSPTYGEDVPQRPGYTDSFEGRSETVLENITTDERDLSVPTRIDFAPYDNPNIAVDTASRFAVHDIIGGTTVRQKIGEEPADITMDGVCTERVAARIDQLRSANTVTLNSDRLERAIRCQVASASTEPLEDGGAANLDEGEFLYEFTINLVEVKRELEGGGSGGQSEGEPIEPFSAE